MGPYPTPATPTASSDSSITLVTSCSEVTGWVRQRAIFSMKDRLASKNSGSKPWPEPLREFACEPRRQQRVEQRGQHDEDRGAVALADDFLAADELEQQRGGGEGREALEQRGQHKAFETVAASWISGLMMAFMAAASCGPRWGR